MLYHNGAYLCNKYEQNDKTNNSFENSKGCIYLMELAAKVYIMVIDKVHLSQSLPCRFCFIFNASLSSRFLKNPNVRFHKLYPTRGWSTSP